jgi:hypothetical protein
MSERSMPIEDPTMKFGLLMESAQAHQKLAESQLEKLRIHTQDLDSVVRDEIRRTLVDELQMLTAETTRATQALAKIRRGGAWRGGFWSLLIAALCTLVPLAIARLALPSAAEVASLRALCNELSARVQRLQQLGGKLELRRCGETARLCVRIDRKAPPYGEKSDYYVVEGY